jgi:hypothetical protein
MKKLILTGAVWIGISAAATCFANDGFKVVSISETTSDFTVKALGDLKFKLTADNLQKKTYIVIKNTKGEILYNEYVSNTEEFSKVYDLSNLSDGEYFFEMISGKEKIVKSFEISTSVKRTALPK